MAAMIAVGPVENVVPKGVGPRNYVDLKQTLSVSLIVPWVFKVRNRVSHGFCSQPDTSVIGAHRMHRESPDRLNIFSPGVCPHL